ATPAPSASTAEPPARYSRVYRLSTMSFGSPSGCSRYAGCGAGSCRQAARSFVISAVAESVRIEALAQQAVFTAALQRALIGRTSMDTLQEIPQPGLARVQPGTRRRCLQRKAHLDIGGGEEITGKPWGLAQLRVQIIEMLPDLRFNERALGAACDGASDRPDQQGHRSFFDAVEYQLQQQRRHRRALGVMQPVGVAQLVGQSR